MDLNQCTIKVVEALNEASQIALNSHHAIIDVDHFLKALLKDKQGLYQRLLGNCDNYLKEVENSLGSKATISSINQENLSISYSLND